MNQYTHRKKYKMNIDIRGAKMSGKSENVYETKD